MLNAIANVASTSAIVGISAPQNISIQFIASAVTTGGGAFVIKVSNDNVNWVTYSRLTANVTNTNSQTDTRTGGPTMGANTSSIFFVPREDSFSFMRCELTPGTDGVYSAVAFFN